MIGVDTNVVVRLLTNDDPEQVRRAADLFARERIRIPVTVLLETEWVLRHAYGLGREAVGVGFRKLLGLPQVTTDDPEVLARALEWYDRGMDFADALHLALGVAGRARGVATFDRAFARTAEGMAPLRVFEP